MLNAKDILTPDEAANELGVCSARVRQLIGEGKIKTTKVGRGWHLIERCDLDQFKKEWNRQRGPRQ